jgi:signal transduction histidine kinase
VVAALTRSDVLILGARGALTAATTNDTLAAIIAQHAARDARDGHVREVRNGGHRYLVATAALGDVATMVFVRDLSRDLAVLPAFRRVIVASGVAALLLGLLLGAAAALRLARPVGALADAADRLAAGDVGAPLMRSSIREIARLSGAFDAMRRALAARIDEVTRANRELADRQARLEAAQSEILQRERLAVSGRLVAEIAHEIRNPVANMRNCLEIVRRRVDGDPEGREFTDLAIDELLRMHELAEQMLDLNRPRDPAVRVCDVGVVVREVVALVSAGLPPEVLTLAVDRGAGAGPRAAVAPDALKQVLLNLVQNAREAITQQPRAASAPGRITITVRDDAGRVMIDVTDDGPGIPADVLPRIFDPFFTTKGAVHGVGLGLFVAEGLVRTAGGRLTASNAAGGGASFHVELPAASPDVPASAPPSAREVA